MKKLIIIPTVFLGIIGGYALAQSEIFSSAEGQTTITAAQAKEAALKAFEGKIVEFEYDHDDFVPHYDFEIVSSTEKVDLEVDAATGDVTITERKVINNTAQSSVKQAVEKVENEIDAAVTNVQVTAQTAAQQVTGQVQEPTAKPKTTEQQATTAKTQTNNPPASSKQTNGIITKAQAIAIAQQKANGTVTKVEYDSDDYEYEIEIKNGNIEYDFEIDARTGAILSYEEDLDD
ncbi:MAG: PepSY domain-containing protein [Lysinibacillus sp.]